MNRVDFTALDEMIQYRNSDPKKLEYIKRTFEQTIDEFAATVSFKSVPLPRVQWDKLRLSDDETKCAAPFRDKPLSEWQTLPKEKLGEVLKILILHDQIEPLANLICLNDLNLNDYMFYGYSNCFNGGLEHIEADFTFYYTMFNLYIRRTDATIKYERDKLTMDLKYQDRVVNDKMTDIAGDMFYELVSFYDYRDCRTNLEMASFRQKLRNSSFTADDIVTFNRKCLRVLYLFRALRKLSAPLPPSQAIEPVSYFGNLIEKMTR